MIYPIWHHLEPDDSHELKLRPTTPGYHTRNGALEP